MSKLQFKDHPSNHWPTGHDFPQVTLTATAWDTEPDKPVADDAHGRTPWRASRTGWRLTRRGGLLPPGDRSRTSGRELLPAADECLRVARPAGRGAGGLSTLAAVAAEPARGLSDAGNAGALSEIGRSLNFALRRQVNSARSVILASAKDVRGTVSISEMARRGATSLVPDRSSICTRSVTPPVVI
jgi:hypothetical protein